MGAGFIVIWNVKARGCHRWNHANDGDPVNATANVMYAVGAPFRLVFAPVMLRVLKLADSGIWLNRFLYVRHCFPCKNCA